MHSRTRAAAAMALLLGGACGGGAHIPKGLIPIRIRVTDSSGAPVSNATVSLVRGLRLELATGTTDTTGMLCFCDRLIFSPDYQVVVRKPGFALTHQFAKLTLVDSLKMDVVLARATLAADSRAATSPKRIDADAIVRSRQVPVNAFDVIRSLRPEMLPTVGAPEACQPVSHLWVNNQLVFAPTTGTGLRARVGVNAPARPSPFDGVSVQVRSALNTIRPEHIASIEYRDCGDAAGAETGRNNALFVVLKRGVQFDESLGSFVGDEPARRMVAETPPADSSVTNVRGAAAVRLIERLESYRYRVLGVFDGDSGAPIDSAEVRELASGTAALTSVTGTVSLAFMRDGGGPVVLSKKGYKADIVTVLITPRDTTWLTFLLFKAP